MLHPTHSSGRQLGDHKCCLTDRSLIISDSTGVDLAVCIRDGAASSNRTRTEGELETPTRGRILRGDRLSETSCEESFPFFRYDPVSFAT